MLGHIVRCFTSRKVLYVCSNRYTCKVLEKINLRNIQLPLRCSLLRAFSVITNTGSNNSSTGFGYDEEAEKDPFFQDEIEKYKKAKRWLATMMGEDAETFTQKDIDEALRYLLPSHLWATDARPQMKHPYDTFPRQEEIEFDQHGRPASLAFYTGKKMFHDLVFEIWSHMEKLDTPLPLEEKCIIFTPDEVSSQETDDTISTDVESGITEPDLSFQEGNDTLYMDPESGFTESEREQDNTNELFTQEANEALFTEEQDISSSPKEMQWVTKLQLEQILNEKMSDKNYEVIIHRLKKLSRHERASEVHDFLLQFQTPVERAMIDHLSEVDIYEDSARSMGYRKKAIAEVIIRRGSGMITINTRPLLEYFKLLNDREQIMFPLLLIDGLDQFDIECHVIGGGTSGKSGAIRLALSRAIAAWCPEHFNVLNNAGLLLRDVRRRERKKPGRKKARRAFAWVKR